MSQLNDADMRTTKSSMRVDLESGESQQLRTSITNLSDHLNNFRIPKTPAGYATTLGQSSSIERPQSFYFPTIQNTNQSVRSSIDGQTSRGGKAGQANGLNVSQNGFNLNRSKGPRTPISMKNGGGGGDPSSRPESPFHFSETTVKQYKDQVFQEEQQIFQQLDQIRVKINGSSSKKPSGQLLMSDQKAKMRVTRSTFKDGRVNAPLKLNSIENGYSSNQLPQNENENMMSPPQRSTQLTDLTASTTVNKTLPIRRLRAPVEHTSTDKKPVTMLSKAAVVAAQVTPAKKYEESPSKPLIKIGKPVPLQGIHLNDSIRQTPSNISDYDSIEQQQQPSTPYSKTMYKLGKDVLRPASIQALVNQSEEKTAAAASVGAVGPPRRRASVLVSNSTVQQAQQEMEQQQQQSAKNEQKSVTVDMINLKKNESQSSESTTSKDSTEQEMPNCSQVNETSRYQSSNFTGANPNPYAPQQVEDPTTGIEVTKINTSRLNCMSLLENLKKCIRGAPTNQFSATQQQFYKPQ